MLARSPTGYHPFDMATDLLKGKEHSEAMTADSEQQLDRAGSSSDSEDEDVGWPAVDPPSFASPSSVNRAVVANLAVLSNEGMLRPFKVRWPICNANDAVHVTAASLDPTARRHRAGCRPGTRKACERRSILYLQQLLVFRLAIHLYDFYRPRMDLTLLTSSTSPVCCTSGST